MGACYYYSMMPEASIGKNTSNVLNKRFSTSFFQELTKDFFVLFLTYSKEVYVIGFVQITQKYLEKFDEMSILAQETDY